MEAEDVEEKAESQAEHSESLWLPRARMQGPDLAHIQHILSNDVCAPVHNSQNADEQRLSTHGPKRVAKYESKGHRKARAYQMHHRQKHYSSKNNTKPSKVTSFPENLCGRNWVDPRLDLEELGIHPWLLELREAALKELVHHAGAGNGNFKRLSGRVSIEKLQDAWDMLSEWRVPKRFFLQYTVNSFCNRQLVLGVDFAMMMVLSHALRTGKLDVHSLHLEVIEAHSVDQAAATAGLISVVRALPTTNVCKLVISLVFAGPNAELTSLEKVNDVILESMGQVSLLSRVDWRLIDSAEFGCEEVESLNRQIQNLKSQTETAAKTSILLAGHERMQGRCRLLGKMPRDLLAEIFRRAFGLNSSA